MRALARCVLAGALCLPLIGHAQDGQVPTRRYALLVGANDGGAERVLLRYAHTDAQSVGQVLSDLGGVPAGGRRLILDPDRQSFLGAFDALEEELVAGPPGRIEVVFYYSGHSDEDGLLLGEERVSYPQLREKLDGLSAAVRVAILDSCASGAMVRGKGGRMVSPFLLDVSTQVEGYAYITSSAADEAAQEADRIQGSYFTHYLTSGLRGAADVSQDGRVTLNEAYQFAFDETLSRTERSQHGPQHPSYDFQLAGTGDFVLTDLQTTDASLRFGEPIGGRLYVRDRAGHLVAELYKPAGRAVELGLAPGSYVITWQREEEYGTAEVALARGVHAPVAESDFSWKIGEVAVARGGSPSADLEHFPRRYARVNFMPGLFRDDAVTDGLVFNLPAGRSGYLNGTAIALGLTRIDRDAHGVLFSLGVNSVGRNAKGLDFAAGVDHVGGTMRGVQFASGVAFTGHDLHGLQLSGGVNVAGTEAHGVQIAGGVNYTGGVHRGVQVSGVNWADGLHGAQIGAVNIGGDVDGAQVGVVNIGGHVRGAMIGVVNIADKVDGVPIGLVSVVKQGRHSISLFANETDLANVEVKLGGRYAYTYFGFTALPTGRNAVSYGLGGTAHAGRLFVDLDFGTGVYRAALNDWSTEPTLTPRVRVSVGYEITPWFAPFAGVQMTYVVPLRDTDVQPFWRDSGDSGSTLVAWPGAFAGIQF